MSSYDKDRDALYSRLDDLCAVAQKGYVGVSQFINEADSARAQAYLCRSDAKFFLWGGYDDAERKRIYLLPDYMENERDAQGLGEYGFSDQIKPLLIVGSGYKKLSHRDFLGSVLGLGIERDVLGDIVVLPEGECSAVAFCDERMADFIRGQLSFVSNDKISVKDIDIREFILPSRRFAVMKETVSSLRLDCVVSALCYMSREQASSVITAGLAEVNFEVDDKADRKLTLPCILSVRGFGKYKLISADSRTRKGKYRLEAEKYL